MSFKKDSNPMNAVPKDVAQEKNNTEKEETQDAHGKEEQLKGTDSQFLRVQQMIEQNGRSPFQVAPILILQGNQIVQVGPSLADPSLVPQIVPPTKMEFNNKTAPGSLAKDGESTKKSLAQAKTIEKNNGVSDVHSVMMLNDVDQSSHRESVRMTKTKSDVVEKPSSVVKPKKVHSSKDHSPSSPKPKRTPSGRGHEHKKSKNASPKSSSSKVASRSRISSGNSDCKAKSPKETVEKVKSKSKSLSKKKKPTSSKTNKNVEAQMSKSNKSKSDKHRQSSSSTDELKKSSQPKLMRIKAKSSSGKANMKRLKNSGSASSSASSESNNFKSHKSRGHKKGK